MSVSGATGTCTTLLMVYMRLEQLLHLVVWIVCVLLLRVFLLGMLLAMINMAQDNMAVALSLGATTDHVFPLALAVVLL